MNIFNLKFAQEEQSKKPTTYWVKEETLEKIKKTVEKLNKIAAKLKLPPITLNELSKKVVPEFKNRKETGRDIVKFEISVEGVVPRVNGWKFIARILHVLEDGSRLEMNMIKAVPNETVPEEYRTAEPNCEHCNSRRERNDTFILQNEETKEYKQVGRNCLADFIRSENPMDYVKMTDLSAQLEDELSDPDDDYESGGGGGRAFSINIQGFIETVMAVSRAFGWVPKSKADEFNHATVDNVMAYYASLKQRDKFTDKVDGNRKPEDNATAKNAIEWAQNLKNDPTNLNDYLWNLTAAATNMVVTKEIAGIVASLPIAYQRATGKAVEAPGEDKEKKEQLIKDKYHIGQKIEEEVKVIKKLPIAGAYGTTNLHTMQNKDGIIFKWFASGGDIPLNASVRIKGTIKDIAPDRYEKNETVVSLTRCKVLETLVEAVENRYLQRDDILVIRDIARLKEGFGYIGNIQESDFLKYQNIEEFIFDIILPTGKFFQSSDLTLMSNLLKKYIPRLQTAPIYQDEKKLFSYLLREDNGIYDDYFADIEKEQEKLPPEDRQAIQRCNVVFSGIMTLRLLLFSARRLFEEIKASAETKEKFKKKETTAQNIFKLI
jgi:hypothetical protein